MKYSLPVLHLQYLLQMGAGTTALVAIKQNKRYIGIELNQEYIKIAENRLKNVQKKLISQK